MIQYCNYDIKGTLATTGTITSGGVITASGGNSSQWNSGYANSITGLSVSGTTTKTLTATQQDGGTLTASWADDSGSNNYLTSLSFNTGNGILTAARQGLSSVTVDLDGRYALSSVVSGVTSIATTNGITGGTITSTGTLQVDSTVIRTTGNQTLGGTKTFSSTIQGNSVNLTSGNGITTQRGSGTIAYPFAINSTTTGLFAASNNANSIITLNRHPGDYYSQLGFSSNGNLYYRNFNGVALNTSTGWSQIAYTSNIPTVNNGTLTMTTSTGLDGGATFTANQSGNSTFAVTLDLTEISLGAGLDSTATGLTLDLSEFTDMTAGMNTNDEFIVLDSSAERRKRAGEIGLSIFSNDAGFITSSSIPSVGNGTLTVQGTGVLGGSGTFTANQSGNSTISVTHDNSGVSAGSYARATVTVNATGHVTSISANSDANTNYYTTTATFNTGNGIISFSGAGGQPAYSVDIDGRFLPLAGGVMSGKIGRSSAIVGFLEGSYNNVGANGLNTNPIYSIGSSYNPASTTLSNMYGVGYTSAGASFITLTGASNWGFYVAANGTARVWLDGSNGNISAAGTIYASGGNSSQWNTHTSNTGTVTSVGISHAGNAFNTGSAVTTSGTLAITMAGSSSQYINGAGNLTTFPSIPQGDITNVTAGTGMTGGGSSGSVTLNVIGGDGITAEADKIVLDNTVVRTSGTQSIAGAKTFTTTPISVTRSTADSSTYLATTAFVKNQGYTSNVGDITGVTAGNKLTGGGTSGTVTLGLASNNISQWTNDSGYTNNVGDITAVTAGTGMTGGGTSGSVTLNVIGGTGITANANDVAVDYAGSDSIVMAAPGGNPPDGDDYMIYGADSSGGGESAKIQFVDIPLSIFDNDAGFSGSGVTAVATTSPLLGGTITGSGTLSLLKPVSGAWHNGGVAIVGTVTEVGRYIDFHTSNTGTSDFDIRLDANGSELNCSGNIRSQGNLEAVGNMEAGYLRTTYGQSYLPSHSFTSDQNTGMYRSGTDQLGFSTGGSQRAFISNSTFYVAGNLGVGTGSPLAKLHVDGISLVRGSTGVGDFYLGNAGTANHFRFHTNNANTYFDMNCGNVYWRDGGSTRYTFFPSTANMTVNGTITQNSDIRIKENVVEIGDCISKVQAMRGVYYNRTDFNTEVTKVGVIAQEVEAVLPELILESPDDGFKSVAYSELTAVLINAIKEQQEIIEDLKTRIIKLEK